MATYRTVTLPDGTKARVRFYGKVGAGPHRHKFDTTGKQANNAQRTCSLCGQKQVKIKGKWTPIKGE